MSDRVQSRRRGGSPEEDAQLSKAEKRAAAKAAKARAATAKKRREALIGALAGVAVLAVIIGTWYWIGTDSADKNTAGAQPTAGPCPGAFPPVPPDGDKALCQKPVVTGGTGQVTKLTVTPLIEGKGPATQAGQEVTVNYVGVSYATGAEFDASWKRQQTFPLELGAGKVIPGWDQGLVGVKVGSRVQLDIPSNLAYGDDPSSGRPTGPLRFVVDVLAAK